MSLADPCIAAVATATPASRWRQEDAYAYLAERIPAYRRPLVKRVFLRAGIEHRHLAQAPTSFEPGPSPDEAQALFREQALELGQRAGRRALAQAGLGPEQIDAVFVATSTGYLCPGLAARLAPRLGLRDDVSRGELVGAGCAGALPALARGHDHVRAYPARRALVICVEICSACFYVDDDLETAVGNSICADGAAAVVLAGAQVPNPSGQGLPRLSAFQTAAAPEHLDSVGFRSTGGRLRIVLSKEIRDLAGPAVRAAVTRTLEAAGVPFEAIDHWVVHSGGRRVLDGISDDLGFGAAELAISRTVLADFGNMSSPTVLFVLERTLAWRRPRPGDTGVLVALGPGLVAEAALLRW